MGNTVTKESGVNNVNGELESQNARRSSHAPIGRDGRSQLVGTSHSAASRSARSHHHHKHHHHHHHHNSKHSEHSRHGYEMIIDANETVDGGYLFPQGVYRGGQDFKVSVVREMIIQRRLAPFYKGLDAVDPNWTDEELLEHVKCDVEPQGPPTPDRPGPPTDKQLIWLYRNVHECPICFLVYPRLNQTRCCSQNICTECFVQIKRNPPHPPYTTNENTEAADVLDLLSEPAACPYCAQPDLGVTFEAPPFQWGIPSSAAPAVAGGGGKRASPASSSSSGSATPLELPRPSENNIRPRRPSLPASHHSVVTIDMIRPDWEEKLASARRRLARKSAAARALHRSALLPGGDESSSNSTSNSTSSSWSPRSTSSLSDVIQASRSMSSAQSRALEQKMIDEAIKASLAQQ